MSKLRIDNFKMVRTFADVLDKCLRTIGKDPKHKEPSDGWKAKIILAEHSPIRLLEFDFTIKNIPMYSSVHLCRHWNGVEKFVQSQRTDRGNIKRENMKQTKLNNMDMTCNSQALINISRKRLCSCASKDTREAWKKVKEEVAKSQPILAEKMVKECIYRGFCPEFFNSCGYDKTEKFKEDLIKYRNVDYEQTS